MSTKKVVGICLIIAGVLVLLYHSMTFLATEDVKYLAISIGEINGESKTIPLPPIIGVASLAVGVVMVVTSGKKK